MEIKVSEEVRAKELKWANNGWHVRWVGPDKTRYTWIYR